MRKSFVICVVVSILFGVSAFADLEQDQQLIRQTALDYIEGWYEGSAERMERALHPDLAKRIIRTDDRGRSRLDQMSALTLVQNSRAGWGSRTPVDQRIREVEILDVYENIASVKITARDWIDYLHVGRFEGRWVIVNVLWEPRPDSGGAARK